MCHTDLQGSVAGVRCAKASGLLFTCGSGGSPRLRRVNKDWLSRANRPHPTPLGWTGEPWSFVRRALVLTAGMLLALLAWDASGMDLVLAQWTATPGGFVLHHNRLFILALHEIPRDLSMLAVVALLLGIAWPWGFLKHLASPDRVQLALSVLGGIALTTLVKRASATSCPWDLLQFGGAVPYVSHWAWGVSDGGPGHCFPAGHASAAFGFLAGWFVLRRALPKIATWWLPTALIAGLVLGVAQQLRGAHFMSHTFWTAWICWSFGLAWECSRALLQALRGVRKLAKLNET